MGIASTAAWGAPNEDRPPPRVQVVLVGNAQTDPNLFARIRSLFDPRTQVVLQRVSRLNSNAVLRPDDPDTLYLWITLSGSGSRVYASAREKSTAAARYLFREVRLDSGLDEVGGETIAQIAHSSAIALWAREMQTSTREVVAELEREPEPPPVTATATGAPDDHVANGAADMSILIPPSPPPESVQVVETVEEQPAPPGERLPFGLAIGGHYAVHASGGEGWLHRVGGFGSLIHKERLSVRALAAYLIPAQFTAPAPEAFATNVDLSGAYGEIRAGWRTATIGRVRGVLEVGFGMLYTSWKTNGSEPALTRSGEGMRPYGVASAGIEWAVGPLSLGAHLELGVPFRATYYDIRTGQDTRQAVSTWLSPGAGFEITVPISRASVESPSPRR